MNSVVDSLAPRTLLDHGDPSLDSRAFRRCLGSYPTGVTVVTACVGERPVGMAVNSFAAVSLDPPLVLWSIRRESRSLQDFLAVTHFAVNILAEDQVETSQHFGAGHPERFALTPWHAGVCGAPLLDAAVAHLECRRATVHEAGDHLILIGHVERYALFAGAPLVFSQGQYAVSQTHPRIDTKEIPLSTERSEGAPESTFLKLLSETHQRMSALFESHRQALGVTHASTRILTRLHQGACGIEGLEQATYLGRHALEDSLADLLNAGLAIRCPDGDFELTAEGRARRDAVFLRSVQFTHEKLQGLIPQDVEAARRVLEALRLR
ncbi:hypothetical protein B9Z47_02060 [Limnohabitans sp. 2KL-1]|uniref:flavin reductase family protein n=1 Tax=Limnohabitans sp. 2KL-1 TaxID=1100699 RepID=UPI000D3A107A|nr:flavin reductase family protein [Limnohabitans sp. 2KL-1]PUE50562.1 hypothetical protein B9Z47_02060 [Limnohabitans sp. 2KL-1]